MGFDEDKHGKAHLRTLAQACLVFWDKDTKSSPNKLTCVDIEQGKGPHVASAIAIVRMILSVNLGSVIPASTIVGRS